MKKVRKLKLWEFILPTREVLRLYGLFIGRTTYRKQDFYSYGKLLKLRRTIYGPICVCEKGVLKAYLVTQAKKVVQNNRVKPISKAVYGVKTQKVTPI